MLFSITFLKRNVY